MNVQEIAGFQFFALHECFVKFDGGAMFGHVPKVVWNKVLKADELNRVEIACHPLLVRNDKKVILIDPGMGTKWNDKEIELYGLRSISLTEQLEKCGLTVQDVDLVILTHLHLDHAGGLTVRNESGELELAFPNAKVLVQKGEWKAANFPDMRSAPSYCDEDFLLLKEKGVLELVDGTSDVFPGCELIVTGAHTKKHQIVRFYNDQEELYFLGDLIPTSYHLKPHWAMGYDLYPLKVVKERKKWLSELAWKKVFGYFFHDPTITFFQLEKTEDQQTKYTIKTMME